MQDLGHVRLQHDHEAELVEIADLVEELNPMLPTRPRASVP